MKLVSSEFSEDRELSAALSFLTEQRTVRCNVHQFLCTVSEPRRTRNTTVSMCPFEDVQPKEVMSTRKPRNTHTTTLHVHVHVHIDSVSRCYTGNVIHNANVDRAWKRTRTDTYTHMDTDTIPKIEKPSAIKGENGAAGPHFVDGRCASHVAIPAVQNNDSDQR